MAVLNSIRKRGVFLIIIIAMALFAFVLDGVINKGTSGPKGEENVATVNGTDLPREEFMKQVENTQRALGQGQPISQAINLVYDREVRKLLLKEQFESLGLSTGRDQLNESFAINLSNNPTFQNEDGIYDELKLQEYLADIKANSPLDYQAWVDYEKSVETNILEKNYFNMVRGGLISTLAEGEQEYRFENDKINIEFVQFPYSKIADEDVPVNDEEIANYIKSHPRDFEIDPIVDIQYISFDEEPSPADIDNARTDILKLLEDKIEYNSVTNSNDTIRGFRNTTDNEDFVNANSETGYFDKWYFKSDLSNDITDTITNIGINEIYGPYKVEKTYNLTKLIAKRKLPDSVKARHILIPFTGSASADEEVTQTEEQAKTLADSILNVIRATPSKFPELVIEYTADKGSVNNEGRYDWFVYNAMVTEFRDFCFENGTGDTGVVKTAFGFHIIEIEGQKNFQDVVKIATITKEIEPSEKTLSDVFSKAANFELDSQNGDFNTLATERGFNVNPVNKIGELDATIPGIGNNRQIINWAFEEDTKVGDIKRFSVSEGYVIAQLTRRNPKGLLSVAEASAIVTPIVRNEKKAKMIRESITGTTLQEMASSQNVAIKTASALTMANPTIAGAGNEPKVVGAAFGKNAGEITELIDGNDGVYIVRVLAVNKAPDLQDYSSYANQLNGAVLPSINSNVYNALKNAADIEDNRADFY
jgi:parvulin-like peptidyl-prolyl isomerase